MHQSHLDFIKQRMCGLLSLLLPLENLATDVPQLGKDSVQRIVKSMTLEEKASLLVGLSMEDYGGEGSVAGHTLRYIPGSAGTTAPMPRYGIPPTVMADGPAGLRIDPVRKGDSLTYYCTAFPVGTMLASTWNTKLIEQVGSAIGNEVLEYGCDVILGPGMNIHRNPLCGRNFEYYSEDGFLSGMMSAYEVAAIQAKGVHVVMKHFALNDCEQDRIGLGVWLNEQAAREVYLKAFQAPVEVGNANGVMIAYTRWGAVWSGGNYGLVTGILRNEWGCDGMVITDNVLTQYVNGPDGVMAGVSIYDAMMSFVTDTLPKYKNDPVIVTAMREACHHNLYAIANSCGMNGVGADTTIKVIRPTIVAAVIAVARVSGILFVLGLILWILGARKLRKTEEYKAYKDFKKAQKAAKKAQKAN